MRPNIIACCLQRFLITLLPEQNTQAVSIYTLSSDKRQDDSKDLIGTKLRRKQVGRRAVYLSRLHTYAFICKFKNFILRC